MTLEVVTGELCTPEMLDLFEHEKIIEQGLASWSETGCALRRIRDDRKYVHAGYDNFDTYCRERWGMTKTRANQLVSGAKTVEVVTTRVVIAPKLEAQVRPLTLLKSEDDQRAAWAEAVETAGGEQPTPKQVKQAVAKRKPPTQKHPATFSKAIIDVIAEHLPDEGGVLDPFAGVGTIHQLATSKRRTMGIEIEPEWARMHADTIEGDALVLLRSMRANSVDAIATSPTYGNRMADHHDASDDSLRLTYKHTLGHDLNDANSGAMQWGAQYRKLHEQAWRSCVRVLRPGGVFVLNIKNHIRAGVVQRVAEWHLSTLLALGLTLEAIDVVKTAGVMAGDNSDARVSHEFVTALRKAKR